MEFGKVRDTRGIDFALPPDDPATAITIAKGKAEGPLRVHVGCPVWQDDAMARKLCPPGTPKPKRLACYAKQFNALELNTTGYAINARNIAAWTAEAPPGFRFCAKVPMDVTHGANLDGVWQRFADHCGTAKLFGDRLGFFFLQFPDLFGPNRFGELERLLDARAGDLPLAVELRHPGWYRDTRLKRKWLDALEARGVAAVITDAPGRRDVLHQRLTTSSAFIRFNGHALGAQDYARLDSWAIRIKQWMETGLRELYLFTHIDPPDRTVELSAHFIMALNQAAGLKLPVPRIRQEEGEELSLAL